MRLTWLANHDVSLTSREALGLWIATAANTTGGFAFVGSLGLAGLARAEWLEPGTASLAARGIGRVSRGVNAAAFAEQYELMLEHPEAVTEGAFLQTVFFSGAPAT